MVRGKEASSLGPRMGQNGSHTVPDSAGGGQVPHVEGMESRGPVHRLFPRNPSSLHTAPAPSLPGPNSDLASVS